MIQIYYLNTGFKIKSVKRLKDILRQIAEKEGFYISSWEITICPEKEMIAINQHILQHDYNTDNICLNYSELENHIDGESFIGIDEIKINAQQYGHSIQYELHKVLIHSLLHLCGYDDSTTKEKKIMNQLENQYIKEYF